MYGTHFDMDVRLFRSSLVYPQESKQARTSSIPPLGIDWITEMID